VDSTKQTRLIPASKWEVYHPWPSNAGLRSIIFNKDTNGFDRAVKTIGRRVLIDEQEFFKWVDSQQKKPHGGPGTAR